MQPLYLTSSDFTAITAITEKLDGLSIVEILNYHADSKFINDTIAAERERRKLAINGGRHEQRVICIPDNVWFFLARHSYLLGNVVLQNLLGLGPDAAGVPVQIKPCRASTNLRKSVAKGDIVDIPMDSLVEGKDVVITAYGPDGVTALADPAPQTVSGASIGSDGLAHIQMTIPSGYSDNKIVIGMFKNFLSQDEFGTHAAYTNDEERHTIAVTA